MRTPLALPIAALLPSSDTSSAPSSTLPSPSFALLGPLPPTTPLHLALNYLAVSDLPEYAPSGCTSRERVLLVMGPRTTWQTDLEEADEEWLRDNGGSYGVLDRLKRVDMRSCPSSEHLKLLMSLLSADPTSASNPSTMEEPPGLVICWDLAGLFLEPLEDDENLPPGQDSSPKGEWAFREGVTTADYMECIAAIRATVQHLSSLRAKQPAAQLIVLEPCLDRFSSLPILASATSTVANIRTPQKKRRVDIKVCLEWLLGDVVGVVSQEDESEIPSFHLAMPDGDSYGMAKRPCPRNEYAEKRRTDVPGEVEGAEMGGWRWHWLKA